MKEFTIKLTEDEIDTLSLSVFKNMKDEEVYLQKLNNDKAYEWNEKYYNEVKSNFELLERLFKKISDERYKTIR